VIGDRESFWQESKKKYSKRLKQQRYSGNITGIIVPSSLKMDISG
jgi:hypothetical protein